MASRLEQRSGSGIVDPFKVELLECLIGDPSPRRGGWSRASRRRSVARIVRRADGPQIFLSTRFSRTVSATTCLRFLFSRRRSWTPVDVATRGECNEVRLAKKDHECRAVSEECLKVGAPVGCTSAGAEVTGLRSWTSVRRRKFREFGSSRVYIGCIKVPSGAGKMKPRSATR